MLSASVAHLRIAPAAHRAQRIWRAFSPAAAARRRSLQFLLLNNAAKVQYFRAQKNQNAKITAIMQYFDPFKPDKRKLPKNTVFLQDSAPYSD
ncbi:hypothetical protein, partial [Paenibacillus cisolokensis]|uniref:hypothetical protein n=1 Tax=Paenibacillus cisolokensis TaxID=1658519 RepID=UPI001BCCB5C7